MSEYNDRELYVTSDEVEAQDLCGRLGVAGIKCEYERKFDKTSRRYFVVRIGPRFSRDRAVVVREKMFRDWKPCA